ncbi:hypothetical protein GSI_13936 [Ganoderma sinense ZZ0214-1]|uniref:PhoD-like phosphatase metallophosphatase domain-containing protein n=1 Tax=Ganoderma sinense ZZ0214-1 TaxID=1077348 RepID=A0A2G8RRQ7_9APHY|nr:hypothetical protein GSI_13936 [Ganoderma sinense ZZ0214-1]
MFSLLLASLASLSSLAGAQHLFDRNLAYSSPFANSPYLSHNTHALHARHVAFAKRQIDGPTPPQLGDTQSSEGFVDEHYPTFYGGDFSASPSIYNGGINFTHSVASGDPFDDSVLLWTRAVPIGSQLPDQSIPICASFKIFDNADLSGRPVDSGDAFTSYDVDWTLKVEANNLRPDSHYWFQFSDCTNSSTVSPVGTTRTISSPNRWFNAYGVAAHNTSADLFLHLGDYIYESLGNGAKIGRQTLGRELATIADYRLRLNQYRTDDDHEVADQAWKAGTADSNDTALGCSFSPSGACFTDRKLAAVRAYHEWMPIRQVDPDDKLRIWRNFQIGKLLDLTMLDTRQYDRDITDYLTECLAVINSIADVTNRSLMGTEQESWFYETLSESKARGATWRVVGQQIVFTMLNESGSLDVDAWDGYRSNRNRVLDHLYTNNIGNTIILSGDSHANWVSDLALLLDPNQTVTYNPLTGEGAIGVEFAGTAVSSTSSFGAGISPANADKISTVLVGANTDLQWSEGSYRGFFTLTLDPHQANATYWAMRNVSASAQLRHVHEGNANLGAFPSATFNVKAGANKLSRPVAGGSVMAGVLKVQGQD